jgi:hypothetical protein
MSIFNDTHYQEGNNTYSVIISSSIVQFWLFLISNILSILSCIFVLYQLLIDRNLRRALQNYCIIILLIIVLVIELIDIPLILQYYRFGTDWQPTPILSLFWTFIDYGFYTAQSMVFAWATIERHILIFHNGWLATRKKRLFLHYLPLITILIYCFTYYGIVIFVPFCENTIYRPFVDGVSYPCVYDNVILQNFDLLCHQIMPTLIIVVFSITLLLRVLWQKTRMHRTIQWRRQRKMLIQLLSISILYLFLNVPWAFILLLQFFGLESKIMDIFTPYAFFIGYYIIFLLPFVCCGSLPQIKMKLKKLLCCQQPPRIFPS